MNICLGGGSIKCTWCRALGYKAIMRFAQDRQKPTLMQNQCNHLQTTTATTTTTTIMTTIIAHLCAARARDRCEIEGEQMQLKLYLIRMRIRRRSVKILINCQNIRHTSFISGAPLTTRSTAFARPNSHSLSARFFWANNNVDDTRQCVCVNWVKISEKHTHRQ